MLIDLKESDSDKLREFGFNVITGSFGSPFKVQKNDNLLPITSNGLDLQGYSEQEIVVIDVASKEPGELQQTIEMPIRGEDTFWYKCTEGFIDPRPFFMYQLRSTADRIFNHGGIFIIFAEGRSTIELTRGSIGAYNIVEGKTVTYTNWDFLTLMGSQSLRIEPDYGQEITILPTDEVLASLLNRFLADMRFSCNLGKSPYFPSSCEWLPLMKNKYGAVVSAAIFNRDSKGWVFIFPEISNKGEFLLGLLRDILPNSATHLFPSSESAGWKYLPQYELPTVLAYKAEINQIKYETEERLTNLDRLIEEEHAKSAYLYNLLTATGDELVAAVEKALGALGFRNIVNMDEQSSEVESSGLREDLQIDDRSPLVLAEVKGISALPSEANSMQVFKYIAPRMAKLKRTDVRGISIINHQRNLPPLDRENGKTFHPDVITNAEHHDIFSLMTTWDLFRLLRSFEKNGWTYEQIWPLFYKSGRIEPVPTHYEYVGKIADFYEKSGVITVKVEGAQIRRGDRMAFDLPVTFEEENIVSMEIDKQAIDLAETGMLVAVKTGLTKAQAKKGIRIFRVRSETELKEC